MEPTGPADPTYAPAPPPRRRSTRLVVVAVVLAVVAAAAIALTVILVANSGETTYTIVTPAQAGGLPRDGTASTLDPSTPGYKNIQQVVNGRAKTTVSALYQNRSTNLLITMQAGTGELGDPSDLLERLRAHPPQASQSLLKISTSWKSLTATAPGPHGGKAACGEVSIKLSQLSTLQTTFTECAWQTGHTFVYLSAISSPTSPVSPEELAGIMRRMRPDLEKPA
jgi:hypothetical protein